ncbi:MAG: ABC transporter permease [Candidatus Omnitrophica bacterium]|nr:ABC transporter permease [Candidatus Omnitrophota bacterium]
MSSNIATSPSAIRDAVCAPVVTIRPSRGWASLGLADLWACRELLGFLVWRDVKIRYTQTAIGVAWAVLQPFAMMVVFTLFFGTLAKLPSEGIPYPLFAYGALLPWQIFSRSLTESASKLVTDQRLVTKVYFPRLLLPLASVLSALVDFLIASTLLVGLMGFYSVMPRATIVWLPLFVGLMVVTALGMGFWLSALNLEYRDVRYLLPFLSQLWLFLTPVVYPSSLVPAQWQWLYSLNPMVGVVDGFRWALFGVGSGPGPMVAVSAMASLALFVSGAFFFRSRERVFADVLGSDR